MSEPNGPPAPSNEHARRSPGHPPLPHSHEQELSRSFVLGCAVPFGASELPGLSAADSAAADIRRIASHFHPANDDGPNALNATITLDDVEAAAKKESASAKLQLESEKELPRCVRAGITEREMLEELIKVGGPCTASLVLMFGTQTITMSYVGTHLGYAALAQFAVGLSAANVLGSSLGIGFAGALDTLAPQAYGRDADTPEMVLLFQRATLYHVLFLLPLLVFFQYCDPLVVAVFGPAMGTGAAAFIRATPVWIILQWMTATFNRLFPAQHMAYVPLLANAAGTLSAIPFNAYILGQPDASLVSSVTALTWIQVVIVGVQLSFALFHPKSLMRRLYIPQPDALQRAPLLDFLRLGVASTVGTCSEWWAYEMLQVMAAQVGEVQVDAFTILLNLLLLYFSVPMGLSIGGGTMVGNAVGANRPDLGRRYAVLTVKLALVVTIFTVGSILVFGPSIVRLYTQDAVVLETLTNLLWFLAIWHIGDTLGTLTLGLFRGAGRQKVAAAHALVGLWLVGLPCAFVAGIYLQHGLLGILLGVFTGVCLIIPLRFYDMRTWDWNRIAAEAAREAEGETASPPAIVVPRREVPTPESPATHSPGPVTNETLAYTPSSVPNASLGRSAGVSD